MTLQRRFERAAKKIWRLSTRPDDATLLMLYSLYKQATEGDAPDKRPRGSGLKEMAKWRAWKKVREMSKEDAMQEYCDLVSSLSFESKPKAENGSNQPPTHSLSGLTFLVTGASRGIGKAIAIRLAQAGANLAVCARTIEPHPKLAGTLPETVATIEAEGGRALAVQLDVRDDEKIADAVNQCVAKFGALDGVICNAGALFIAPFEDTPMKKFDLVHQVNVRSTYALIQAALPHLKKSKHPRILVLSPPVSMEPRWLAGTTAYTISKYGMSILVGGLAAEFEADGIAVNSLWPATTIDTAAVRFNEALGGEEMANRSRKPTIVADAAFHILSSRAECTGRFYTDEQALAEAGVTDLAEYAVTDGVKLQQDFYV